MEIEDENQKVLLQASMEIEDENQKVLLQVSIEIEDENQKVLPQKEEDLIQLPKTIAGELEPKTKQGYRPISSLA